MNEQPQPRVIAHLDNADIVEFETNLSKEKAIRKAFSQFRSDTNRLWSNTRDKYKLHEYDTLHYISETGDIVTSDPI